jgi:O-6-methylguanine DNA methyltransferase
MIELDGPDRLDALLREHFRPETVPAGLADQALARARPATEELVRFEQRLDVQATARGVSLIRAGAPERPATAAARRLVEQARGEIAEYLAGKRVFFSVPVDLSETAEFQRRVLEAAQGIPFGEARPYAWIAQRIGRPRAVRAVGTALGRNPVPLIVPCHRVWRSDGGFGGYLFGAELKRRLADLERATPVLEGSASTRVVCRVGCAHGRRMRPDDRVIFASVDDARSVGYRACAVCRPEAA